VKRAEQSSSHEGNGENPICWKKQGWEAGKRNAIDETENCAPLNPSCFLADFSFHKLFSLFSSLLFNRFNLVLNLGFEPLNLFVNTALNVLLQLVNPLFEPLYTLRQGEVAILHSSCSRFH
jgi:hypothetical protein